MAGGNLNHGVRLVAQNHVVRVWIDRRPTSKEDGILEHGLDTLFLESPLFMKEKRGGDGCAFGITDDSIERASFFHDFEQILERIVGAAV